MPGCGSAWLERLVWDQEVAGSNPVTPIHNFIHNTCGCSSMVEHQPSKLDTWVRFPSPAFFISIKRRRCETSMYNFFEIDFEADIASFFVSANYIESNMWRKDIVVGKGKYYEFCVGWRRRV